MYLSDIKYSSDELVFKCFRTKNYVEVNCAKF
jgi:uncharacterized Fe-S radical SAM superfamily protein PflX